MPRAPNARPSSAEICSATSGSHEEYPGHCDASEIAAVIAITAVSYDGRDVDLRHSSIRDTLGAVLHVELPGLLESRNRRRLPALSNAQTLRLYGREFLVGETVRRIPRRQAGVAHHHGEGLAVRRAPWSTRIVRLLPVASLAVTRNGRIARARSSAPKGARVLQGPCDVTGVTANIPAGTPVSRLLGRSRPATRQDQPRKKRCRDPHEN